ncbi:murein biosynthesis integral membrane protein MurJ [Nakamurella deserti]|uniref:murein biosynthesis integral membrane protein MurJ n=1 Tax=Nakamurella deserti TaxID=2164074 RepID=UPI001300542B|nr:murein biosynthesis integral membrane protein MurJ [Nakamurella deserti]
MTATATPSPRGIVRASALMAVAALTSRVTGLLSKVVLLGVLGLTVNDSYWLANTLPNIVFELLIGGVLTSVAIPLLARAQRSDPDGGVAYTQQLVTLALVALTVTTLVAVAAAPLLIDLYLSPSFQGDTRLATVLAYLLLPQILFYGLAALFGAILNTKERFAGPAWAPVLNNVVVIGMAVYLAFLPGGLNGVVGRSGDRDLFGPPTTTQILVLGIGTTAGIVLQAMVLLPSLRRAGFRFRWRLRWDARMGEAGGLAGWAVAYVVVSQVGYVVATNLASRVDGGISTFSFANLLFQTPYGILGVSVLTAVMPRMSRHAAAGEMELVKDDVSLANRLSTVALLPITAGVLALSGAIGVLTSAYNKVSIDAAIQIGITFAALGVGLVPLAMTLVQMRVFYAMKDGRTPVVINAVMVGIRIPLFLLAATLSPDLLIPGLAGATAISYIVGAVVGELWLRHRFGPMGSRRMLRTLAKMAVASVVAGGAAFGVVRLGWGGHPDGWWAALAQGLAGGAVGALVIAVAAVLLKVEEFEPLVRRLRVIVRRQGRQVGSGGDPAGSVATTDVDLPDVASREQVSIPVSRDPSAPDESDSTRTAPDLSTVTPAPASGSQVPPGRDDTPAGSAPRAESDAARVAPGSMVGGRYRLVSLVAVDAGGNRFWRAKDTVLPRDMAVTLLPDGPSTNATVTTTLRAGRLHHIGLPQTLDLGTENGMSYVVGQWVDGATLTDLLAGGPLDGDVAGSVTAKVADAVAEAHRNGIALGALHPSLVRVNFDGQVRLSHVLAYPGATPEQDIRAVGALLYLMITGTFPLPQNGMSPPLTAAPTGGGRELPADEVRTTAPAGLSALAERALHPEGPHGVRSAAAIAALLHSAEAVPVAAGAEPDEEPVLTAGQLAERRLIRERRAKLGVAGVMLLALTVLVAIVIGSAIKRVVDSVQDPVITSDQALDVTPETLAPTAGDTSAPVDTATPETTAEAPPTSAAVTPVPVAITAGEVYDPQGRGQKDYVSYIDRAFDGDPGTAWQTFAYFQQFGPNGLKTGVGLMLTLDREVRPLTVTVATTTPSTADCATTNNCMKVQIRASDGDIDAPLDATTVLAESQIGDAPAAIAIPDTAPTSRYLIVFVSGLTGGGNNWEASLSEIQVTAAG